MRTFAIVTAHRAVSAASAARFSNPPTSKKLTELN